MINSIVFFLLGVLCCTPFLWWRNRDLKKRLAGLVDAASSQTVEQHLREEVRNLQANLEQIQLLFDEEKDAWHDEMQRLQGEHEHSIRQLVEQNVGTTT